MPRLHRALLRLTAAALLTATACSSGAATPAPSESPSTPTQFVPPTSTPLPTATLVPTDTPEPAAASGGACVVGTWELSDMSAYMSSIIPAGSDAEFTFAGQEGYVRYTFGPDGTASFEANDFVVRFAVSVSNVSFDLAVSMDGTGVAAYSADAGSMTLSDSDVDALTFSATLGETELFSGTSGELASLFGVSEDTPSVTFAYQCEGDRLTYTPPAGIEGVQPVVLTRVEP